MNSQNINKTSDTASCCQKACRQLQNQKEYHFTLKMFMELMGPLVLFISGLVIFQVVFANVIKTEQLQAVVSFLLSAVLTCIVIVSIKKINKSIKKS